MYRLMDKCGFKCSGGHSDLARTAELQALDIVDGNDVDCIEELYEMTEQQHHSIEKLRGRRLSLQPTAVMMSVGTTTCKDLTSTGAVER